MSVRKKLQETLINSERLSAVGEMASGVAHNFNNLLQMIMAGAEAAQTKLESGNIRDCWEAVNNIIAASKRGADVVRRIKDFTHVSPGGVDEGAIFDLNALVAEAVELTKPLWKPPFNPSKYTLNFVKSQDSYVKGKSSEIFEVLVNLIKNALEAMPRGGGLTIVTHEDEANVFLRIADTGHGISDEHLQRIFEPFFTTKGSRSSGLGLSSCYGIVKKNNGEIQVKSELGQGAEFVIAFPRSRRPDAQRLDQESFVVKSEPIRFLIIDDEINILNAMKMYFEDSEIDIATAHTASDGLSAIESDRFDVILCDLSMNDMNGLEVGKWVLDYSCRQKTPKIPFLLYTGLEKHLDAEKLEESGVDLVVNKPTPCEEILRIVKKFVDIRK
jgi:CheY-like chemotaxis protein